MIELELESTGFWGEGKTGVPGRKTSRSKGENQHKLNPHIRLSTSWPLISSLREKRASTRSRSDEGITNQGKKTNRKKFSRTFRKSTQIWRRRRDLNPGASLVGGECSHHCVTHALIYIESKTKNFVPLIKELRTKNHEMHQVKFPAKVLFQLQ